MKFKIFALACALLLAWFVTMPAQAQVKLEDLGFQNKPVEPGAGLIMLAGTQTGSAALGDGVIVFKFRVTDVDPIADDASDVEITCILIQNLGTATAANIVQVMVLDQDSNAVPALSGNPSAPAAAGAQDPAALAGATQGCAAMTRTTPNAQIAWENFFNLGAAGTGAPFIIPDDGTEEFLGAVRTATTDVLLDDSQNHTLVLRATLQVRETVGSPPAPTTFVDPVTDGAHEVIWNGGVNRFTEDTWVVNPIMPGSTGVVSRFTVCDYDADEDQLILQRFFVRQDEGGTALSSDIVSLDLYRVEGFTRTLVASRTPDTTFERGSGAVDGLAIPGGAITAITIPDDTCYTFELEAQVSPFAFKGHVISPRISVQSQEPAGTTIDETVEPEIRTRAILIGTGLLVLPDTKLVGKPGILPLQVAGFALPGLGTLQVGPNGKLQFDPRVFNIKSIEGAGPYLVGATEIDNRRGEARFTVQVNPNYDVDGDGNPDNPLLTALQDGTIAHILITPTGTPGSRSRLVLTFDCVELVDQPNCLPVGFPNPNVPNQKPNNDISVSAGEVVILYPGDIDMDGVPTIRDSLLLANAILDCTATPSQPDAFPSAIENVVWDTNSDANVAISGNNLTKNAGGAAFNAGAVSTKKLYFGNGFVETTVDETNTDRLFGLSKGDTDQSESDIDFAIFLKDNGQLEVRRNATQIVPNPAVSYATNDVLRVEVSGDDVLFKKNGVTFLTLSNVITTNSYPLLVDTSLFDVNATLENVRIQSLGGSTIGSTALVGLTDEQKSVADVASPFADIDEIPDCNTLTSADVAEIARLAINFGTTPAPSAAVASVATPIAKPWYGFLGDLWAWLTGASNGLDQAYVGLDFNAATQSIDLGVSETSGIIVGGIEGRIAFDPVAAQVSGVTGLNGYVVLAYQVDNHLGEVRFLALAPKGQGFDQGDIVRLHLNDARAAFAPALTVEALVDEDALDIPFALEQSQAFAAAPEPLSLGSVQALSQPNGTWRFQALGTGITAVQVQVFNLAGAKVFDQQAAGNSLSFAGLSASGKPLANGVYLYVIIAKGANGQSVRSQVNKLAILR